MNCQACARAKVNPLTGHYMLACRECEARALANSPAMADASLAEAIIPAYRSALQAIFGADWMAGHSQVKVWAEKISSARSTKGNA